MMKEREFLLLNAISEDETVTQAGLASQLGMAIGSVNWYIKRLIGRGYIKVTRMDRTRLRYNLTPSGLRVLTKNATQYIQDSLSVYRGLRDQARVLIGELRSKDGKSLYIPNTDDGSMDILKLTCMEMGIGLDGQLADWTVKFYAGEYRLRRFRDKGIIVEKNSNR